MDRGFTLVEIMMVVVLTTLLTGGFLAWAAGLYRQEHVVFTQADVEAEGSRAVALLQRHLKHSGRGPGAPGRSTDNGPEAGPRSDGGASGFKLDAGQRRHTLWGRSGAASRGRSSDARQSQLVQLSH